MKKYLLIAACIFGLGISSVYAAGDDEPTPTTICDFLVRIDKRLDKIERRLEKIEQSATPQLSEVIGAFGEKKPTYFSPDDVLQDDGQPVEKVSVTMMSTIDTNMTTGFREPFTQYKQGKTYEVLPNVAKYWTERGLAKKEFNNDIPSEVSAARISDTDAEIYVHVHIIVDNCSVPKHALKGWTGEGKTNLGKGTNHFVEYSQTQELIRQRQVKEV